MSILGDYHHWPQFLAGISFSEDDEWISCEVEEGGELICRLRGHKIPSRHIGAVRIYVYTPGQAQPSRADINPAQSATSRDAGDVGLTLGAAHPIAAELSRTLRSTKPRIYNYGPRWQFILFGPEGASPGGEGERGESIRRPR